MAHLLLHERFAGQASAMLAASMTAGKDVGVTMESADEWLTEALTSPPPPPPDPEVTAWREAVGLSNEGR